MASRRTNEKVKVVRPVEEVKLEEFDVVPSPLVVDKLIDDHKGSVLNVSLGLNVIKDKNHFDQIRTQKDTVVQNDSWRDSAMVDSDDELAPIEAIVPTHL